MRRVADAVFPLIGRQSKISALFLIGIVAHLRGDVALCVQNSDPALQFWKHGVLAADMHGGRHPEIFLDHFDEVTVKVPIFDAIVVAVANEQQRFFRPRVQSNSVTGFEFSFRFARTAEGFYELCGFCQTSGRS